MVANATPTRAQRIAVTGSGEQAHTPQLGLCFEHDSTRALTRRVNTTARSSGSGPAELRYATRPTGDILAIAGSARWASKCCPRKLWRAIWVSYA